MKIGGLGSVEVFSRPNMMTARTDGNGTIASEFSLSGETNRLPKLNTSKKDVVKSESREPESRKAEPEKFEPLKSETAPGKVKNSKSKDSTRDEEREKIASSASAYPTSLVMINQPDRVDSQNSKASESIDIKTGLNASRIGESLSQVPKDTQAQSGISIETESGSEDASTAAVQAALTQAIQDLTADLGTVQVIEQDTRNAAMKDFLAQMKSEFGIKPEQVIKAFAGLAPEKLAAAPDATMNDVLKSLGIKPEQMPKAERIYSDMLNATGESALNETLAGASVGVTLKVLSEKELAFEKLQKSITDLNDSFAIRNQPVVETAELDQAVVSNAPSEEQPLGLKESSKKDFNAALKEALSQVSIETGTVSNLGVNQVKASAKPVEVSQRKTENLDAILKEAGSEGQPQAGFVLPDSGKTSPLSQASSPVSIASAMMPQSETAVKENAQEVIRNAQLLLQKGGGEMKMQLKPEGVGEVQLKVQVKDGQVAVQMLTESDSAKKLLETGLEDLKTSLAANKLHVDALKIEVGTEMAKQRFEQSQQDASREQARQLAQDFMGQFRQDRETFRQGFADGSGLRSYGAQRRPAPPEMEIVSSQSGNKSSASRRLDLVA